MRQRALLHIDDQLNAYMYVAANKIEFPFTQLLQSILTPFIHC